MLTYIKYLLKYTLSGFLLKFIISYFTAPLHSMTYPNSRDMSANNRPHAVLATTFLWWTPHLARPPMTLAMEQCSENASRASLASYRMNLIFQKWKRVTLLSWNHLLFWPEFLNFLRILIGKASMLIKLIVRGLLEKRILQ